MEISDNETLEILKAFKLEFKALNDKIDRNGIMLEQLNKKVEIIAKVQMSHK